MGIYECLVFIQHKVISKFKIIIAEQVRFKFNLIVCIAMD